jgi:PadR family transcriptional regulator AphA
MSAPTEGLLPASFVVLGMVRIGANSGYQIKRSAELSVRFFWALSPVQIYAELKRLEETGLIHGQDDPRGGRQRRIYQITSDGESALHDWLLLRNEPKMEWRDEGLLKLFFADALAPADALSAIRAIRSRSERFKRCFDEVIEPAAKTTESQGGHRFPQITARFGNDFHTWVSDWCVQLEGELEGEQPSAQHD